MIGLTSPDCILTSTKSNCACALKLKTVSNRREKSVLITYWPIAIYAAQFSCKQLADTGEARHRMAQERCDALTGVARSSCITAVNATFGHY